MSESVIPLPLSCRTSDDDYPSTVAQLGPDWRLAVSMNADRFSLQQRGASGAWYPAGGSSPATLAKIVAKYDGQVEGLASLCATLPDDPASAAPDFMLRRQAQLALIRAGREAKAKPPARRRVSALDRFLDI